MILNKEKRFIEIKICKEELNLGTTINTEDMKKNRLASAYARVLSDLTNMSGIFTGVYDAENGDESFMYGVQTVMETIASGAGDNKLAEFSETFTSNMIQSECNAKVSKNAECKKIVKTCAIVGTSVLGIMSAFCLLGRRKNG